MVVLNKRNILLRLEYRGDEFDGWQIQARGRTVQGELKKCLQKFLREDPVVTGAGRTDAGVHALAQYANFTTANPIKTGDIMHKLNRMLPEDIVVTGCSTVPPKFDSRRSAIARSYRYQISERLTAVNRGFSWVIGRKLELSRLNDLAAILNKSSHFGNFCKVKSRKFSNDCVIIRSSWSRYGGFLRFDISADRFLHNMVRLLVGTMVAVIDGKMETAKFEALLKNEFDDKTKFIAPACGLFLAGVEYEGINL